MNINDLDVEVIEAISKTSLHDKIGQVDNYIGNNHDSTAFIKFEVNSFKLDTRSPDTRKHYAISLENQKTGAGVGNKFTLRIAYNANFSEYSSATELEAALSLLSVDLMNKDVDEIRNITSSGKNRCKLQYGYLNNQSLVTSEYTGILLKYTVTANKQIIEYTLTGVAGEEANLTTVNWYPHIKGLEISGDDTKVAKLMQQAEAANRDKSDNNAAYEELVNTFNQYWQSTVTIDPFNALQYFISDYNYNITRLNQNATRFELCVMSDAVNAVQNLKTVVLSQCRNQTPISYIEYLISMFSEKTTKYSLEYYKEQLGITNRWVHEFKYDKDKNVIKVILNRISSDENTRNDYEFKGYVPNNNLLIDYNLQYDGSVALAVANNTSADAGQNAIYIDKNGQLQAKASITNDMFVAGEIDEVLIKNQNTWVDKICCANNCSMTTFGLPFEIPVGAVFKVTLYLGNKPHHTSGRCFVTGITDKIQDNSFTTQFSMIRLPGKGGV